jgi:anti-sigma factor RsiW
MSDEHSAVGSYVTDALSPAERAEFETHLTSCISCRLEVAEYTETLAQLTPLVETRPPAALRSSVLNAIRAVQPMAPEIIVRPEERARRLAAGADSPDLQPWVPAAATELRPLGPDEVVPLDEHPSEVPDWTWLGVTASLSDDLANRRSRRTDRILTALVAAALIVALAFSGWVYVSWQQNKTQVTETQQETEVLTAPDVKVYPTTVKGEQVSFIVSKELNRALFIANNLPNPDSGRTYQLWKLNGDVVEPAGLVREGGDVRESIRGVNEADSLALTQEPGPDGSKTTPTPPLLAEVSLR